MHNRNDGNHSFLIISISDSCLNEWEFYGTPKLGTWDKVCRVQAKAGRITEGHVGCDCLMQDNWLLGLLEQTQSLKSPFSITMNGSVLSVQGSTLAVVFWVTDFFSVVPSGSQGQLCKAPLTLKSTEPMLESLPACYLTVDLV